MVLSKDLVRISGTPGESVQRNQHHLERGHGLQARPANWFRSASGTSCPDLLMGLTKPQQRQQQKWSETIARTLCPKPSGDLEESGQSGAGVCQFQILAASVTFSLSSGIRSDAGRVTLVSDGGTIPPLCHFILFVSRIIMSVFITVQLLTWVAP